MWALKILPRPFLWPRITLPMLQEIIMVNGMCVFTLTKMDTHYIFRSYIQHYAYNDTSVFAFTFTSNVYSPFILRLKKIDLATWTTRERKEVGACHLEFLLSMLSRKTHGIEEDVSQRER